MVKQRFLWLKRQSTNNTATSNKQITNCNQFAILKKRVVLVTKWMIYENPAKKMHLCIYREAMILTPCWGKIWQTNWPENYSSALKISFKWILNRRHSFAVFDLLSEPVISQDNKTAGRPKLLWFVFKVSNFFSNLPQREVLKPARGIKFYCVGLASCQIRFSLISLLNQSQTCIKRGQPAVS